MTELTKLELTATYLGLRDIGGWLDELFAATGWSGSPSRGAIELAIHEMATNVVDHAAPPDGKMLLSGRSEGNDLHVELTDNGEAFEPAAHVPPDDSTPQVRGYGLMIVEQLAHQLDYQRANDRNVWTATFAVDPAAER